MKTPTPREKDGSEKDAGCRYLLRSLCNQTLRTAQESRTVGGTGRRGNRRLGNGCLPVGGRKSTASNRIFPGLGRDLQTQENKGDTAQRIKNLIKMKSILLTILFILIRMSSVTWNVRTHRHNQITFSPGFCRPSTLH